MRYFLLLAIVSSCHRTLPDQDMSICVDASLDENMIREWQLHGTVLDRQALRFIGPYVQLERRQCDIYERLWRH